MLFIGQCLGQSPIRSVRDLAAGLFLAQLALHYSVDSKRYIPELIAFITEILRVGLSNRETAKSSNAADSKKQKTEEKAKAKKGKKAAAKKKQEEEEEERKRKEKEEEEERKRKEQEEEESLGRLILPPVRFAKELNGLWTRM